MIINAASEPTSGAPASYREPALAAKLGTAARDIHRDTGWATFSAGAAKLTCQSRFSCGLREFFSAGDATRDFYANQQWAELASNVLRINFKMDINYYYLGRAAEAIGAYRAAGVYYKEALKLSSSEEPDDRCATRKDWCSGVDLASDVPRRLERVTAMARYQFE